jgi:Lipid desaturase domain
MNLFQSFILTSTMLVFIIDTCILLYNIKSGILSAYAFLMPILGFHSVALIINFIHWGLDTWTSKDNKIRKRFFNQAKSHHYYPHLVVKKEYFSRNDDVIYGSLIFGSIFFLFRNLWSLNVQIYFHSLIWSTFVSLEIHRHAHMKIEDVPSIIRFLQKSDIILSRESHYRHHNGQFNCSYDLMSGYMNKLIDFLSVYPALEYFVENYFGVQPRTYLKDEDQKREFKEYYELHA